MPRVLILSSHVASGRVGGGAQALALARLGIEPILVPTVLFGRHPGYGPPGGAAVEPATFEAMIEAIEAQGLFETLDAVITGHFSLAQQVAIAAEALSRVKAANPHALMVVDPIMGDADKGLYVREPVAEALAQELVPQADLVAPNAWELARLAEATVADPAGAVAAARGLGKPTLVSSIRHDGEIGVVHADAAGAWFCGHPERERAPKGTGDLLTALFVAARLSDLAPEAALAAGVGAVAAAVDAAAGAEELPLSALPLSLATLRTPDATAL